MPRFPHRQSVLTCVAGCAIAVFVACGGSNNTPAAPAPATNGSAQNLATKQVNESAKQSADGAKAADSAKPVSRVQPMPETAKPVDFEALKALLPDVDGWQRANPAGEMHTLPVAYASAHARYTSPSAGIIDLEITDSALSQVLLPISIFMANGFEEKNEDGHTKSLTLRGSPGYENWNKTGRTADVTVVVASRFVVRGRGRQVVGIDPVRTVVQAVNFQQLGKLK